MMMMLMVWCEQRWGEIVPIRFQLDKTGFAWTLQMFACFLNVAAQHRLYALIGICRSMQKKTHTKMFSLYAENSMLLTHEDDWQSKLQEGYLVSNENGFIIQECCKNCWILNARCFVMHFSDYNIFTDEEWEEGQATPPKTKQTKKTVVNDCDADRKWEEKNNQQNVQMYIAQSQRLYILVMLCIQTMHNNPFNVYACILIIVIVLKTFGVFQKKSQQMKHETRRKK